MTKVLKQTLVMMGSFKESKFKLTCCTGQGLITKVPKGLISGMLNKGIEMRGFWSGFKLNFYKKKIIVHIKGRK